MIVADTCLIIHLFNETHLTPVAQKILELYPQWIVPPLWKEEYANVLSKLTRREERNTQEVLNHFESILAYFHGSEQKVDIRTAFEISLEYQVSVYDAHFLALAIEHEILLITEDKEVLKRCPHLTANFKKIIQ